MCLAEGADSILGVGYGQDNLLCSLPQAAQPSTSNRRIRTDNAKEGGKETVLSASPSPPEQILKNSTVRVFAEGSIISFGNKSFAAPPSLQHLPLAPSLPKQSQASLPASWPPTSSIITGQG